ncbi:hypothetical protein WJX73_000742 [Symbiochloris irregularis]|uniref:Uncharacterized protein n=1 Tax=Symbiochloris irregularis TaxID=706552 RepID=A0AAW1NWI2_9CHLO
MQRRSGSTLRDASAAGTVRTSKELRRRRSPSASKDTERQDKMSSNTSSTSVAPKAGSQDSKQDKPAAQAGNTKPEVVSQEGFDYVLDAMNGEDNMKEETKEYKPAKSSNFRARPSA